MKIVADENIAGLREFFSAHGEIIPLAGRKISARDLHEADALLVRSVTPVHRTLLEHSPVRFVGSCTIGIDHLDIAWLGQQGIHLAYAPGCNAKAVVDYVLSCLLALDLDIATLTVGIVGCGNVGGLLNQRLRHLGIRTLCCDPFLADTAETAYIPLAAMLPVCDVLCVHTPLTHGGAHPTWHLMGRDNLALMKTNAVLLNAGRGAVVDTQALLEHLYRHPGFATVLDVWEHEPHISGELLERVSIATPHVAGYSLAGKWRGSAMIHKSFCEFFGLAVGTDPVFPPMSAPPAPPDMLLKEYVLGVYDPLEDSRLLKATAYLDEHQRAIAFDRLRRDYVLRLELGEYAGKP
jgi:erythronate-4-phosphate dehydrogenase